MEELKSAIRDILDFPKPGIIFKDITTLLNQKDKFKKTIDQFAEHYKEKQIDYIVGVESRGFIIGAALSYVLGAGFVPIRKKGKLPAETIQEDYELEYGTDTLEIHKDAIPENANVLIVDDLLATGGTLEAVAKLVEKLNANIVSIGCIIELSFLNGRDKLKAYDIFSLITY
ncbi:adenine phosphoribosyltransferase [bacterium]